MKISTTLLLLLSVCMLQAQPNINLDLYASGFSRPVSITNAGDDRLFVLEQVGRIKIIDGDGNTLPDAFLDIQSRVNDNGNEQGLLGLAFPPDYQTSGVFYVNYTGGTGSGNTKISRFKVDPSNPNKALEDSEEIILTFNQPFTNHNGGDLNFGPDGFLYIAQGDGGSANDPGNRAQNLNQYLGKILRIDVDTSAGYKIPATNPFIGVSSAKEEIWSYGLRNPWRFSFDSKTGDMWIADVGQGNWEEVDFEPVGINGGVNYGWKCYEGNSTFSGSASCQSITHEAPIFEYPHNNSSGGFSITGGFVYRGDNYPELNGNYICGDYVTGNFWMISQNDETNEWMSFRQNDALFNVSGFGEDANAELFVANLNGNIYRVVGDCPDSTIALNLTTQNDTIFSNSFGSNFEWYLNGSLIPDANQNFIIPESNGDYYCTAIVNVSGCHYNAFSDTINRLDCGDTTLIVNLVLENDTLKPSISTGTFVWYLNGEEISETQPYHIPLEVGEYYVEVTQDVEECILFGQSDTITTECTEFTCNLSLTFENDTLLANCAFGTLSWFLEDNLVATTSEEEPFIIPTTSGLYSIETYDSIAPYCVRSDETSLNIVISSIRNTSALNLNIFPNPARNLIHASYEGELKKVRIYNANGKNKTAKFSKNLKSIQIDIKNLAKGNYFVELVTDNNIYVGHFIKE